ncbi:hypothetical protein ARMGADRAFT_1008567 [Armillaria gallica]|uniref:Uncharacterized protein n=1 Tax=Armillaria gallica TaxID=47427 RepID=A0A2H3E9J4_ARMGA|nr:hypothetical protein ARMGADRAFT_1008567 [Armillaria gallica]
MDYYLVAILGRIAVGHERERHPAPTPLDGTCPSYPPHLSSRSDVLTIPVPEFALGRKTERVTLQ